MTDKPALWSIALLVGLITLAADQVADVVAARSATAELVAARAQQAKPLAQAAQVEAQLEALAAGTARLANGGNANAQQIVAALRASGVSINPDGTRAKPS